MTFWQKNKIRFLCFCCIFCFFSQISFFSKSLKNSLADSYSSEAKAECVMEANSRRVLYESHGDLQLPMASTTKIVTAITVLELCGNIQEKITIPPEAEGIEGSSVYLKAGDVYTVEELLYGLMLRSGNDCAVALALHCSKSIQDFSVEMNKVAQKAGALNSNFKNPHGLPCKGHYTTAHDLTLIACYAMQNPLFAKIVQTKFFAPCNWANKNKMLTQYEGGIGIKTGYTKEAGRCLVASARKENMTLICTVLNCKTTYERCEKLLNDAYNHYNYKEILNKDTVLCVNNQKGHARKSYFYPLLKEEEELLEITTTSSSGMKIKNKKEIIGQFEIYLSKQLLFSGNLYKL